MLNKCPTFIDVNFPAETVFSHQIPAKRMRPLRFYSYQSRQSACASSVAIQGRVMEDFILLESIVSNSRMRFSPTLPPSFTFRSYPSTSGLQASHLRSFLVISRAPFSRLPKLESACLVLIPSHSHEYFGRYPLRSLLTFDCYVFL